MSDSWELGDEAGIGYAEALVTEADVPDYGSDAAEHADWLRGLPDEVRAGYESRPWAGPIESEPAGFWHHDTDLAPGIGFAAGGPHDTLPPGPDLAHLTAAADSGRAQLGESQLIGVLCAWQRLISWAQAGQAATVTTLAHRRDAQARELNRPALAEHVSDEMAAALRLTGRSASRLLDTAAGLHRLPGVLAALNQGEIDWAKACLFTDLLAGLPDDDAARIADGLLGRAGGMTSGQLRAALTKAVLAHDPEAAERRQDDARTEAAVCTWTETSGNAALAGRELATTDVIHARVRLTALARWLHKHGATGTMDQLRAAVYIALLTGRTVQSLLPQDSSNPAPAPAPGRSAGCADTQGAPASPPTGPGATRPGATGPGATGNRRPTANPVGTRNPDPADNPHPAADPASTRNPDPTDNPHPAADPASARNPDPADSSADAGDWPTVDGTPGDDAVADDHAFTSGDWPQLTGTVNLTMPMSAWLCLTHDPGEAASHGPIDARTGRELASRLDPATRWCLTLTDTAGHAVAHACAPSRPPGSRQPGFEPPGSALPSGISTILTWAAGLDSRMQTLQTGSCSHVRQSARYRPPPSLRHLIVLRQRTCSAPGCRRAAVHCDLDHTIPYDDGGRTCECNLAPLCRRHHRAKQAPGWHLEQREPGQMIWRLPSGRVYETTRDPY